MVEGGPSADTATSPVQDKTGLDQRVSFLNRIRALQQVAVIAVSRDQAGNVDAAIEHYDKVIQGMDDVAKALPQELQLSFLAQMEGYQERKEKLCLFKASPRSKKISRVPFEEDAVAQLSVASLEGLAEKVQAWEKEPDTPVRRPYWVLRLVRTTITSGGHLTPRLHIPRVVWEQDGAKFMGLLPKIQAFESILKLLIDRVAPLEAEPRDAASVRRCISVFRDVRLEFDQIQNNLSRPFPFIREALPPPRSPSSAGGSGAGGNSTGDASAPVTTKSPPVNMQQRLSTMVFAIGKSVSKSAATAYERIGAAVPTKITDEQLMSYAVLVADVCDKCQLLDRWAVNLDKSRKEIQGRLRKQAGGGKKPDHAAIEADVVFLTSIEELFGELHCLARFIQMVVVEVLIRDVEGLLERYLRKMRKSFAKMHWDEEGANA